MVSALIPQQSRVNKSFLKSMQLLLTAHPFPDTLLRPHLPPLVVTGICHVQDVPVVEAQASARQSIVLVRVVLEQRPDIERPLGAGPHQRPCDVLLQLMQPGLVPAQRRNVKRNTTKKGNKRTYCTRLACTGHSTLQNSRRPSEPRTEKSNYNQALIVL